MSRLKQGADFYYDEHDNIVLTAEYHLNKGYCCGHGCLHCPYDYENVPEPRRTLFLKERNNVQQKANKQTPQNR
ncbi:hypothetical protein ESA94_10415 [Lacibacter luteus]|uniref:Uncharacterized protein n=1 Tax=Lacibacter luteus TaxID=2508719 RepID=A0A4Q1CKG0_9BACT|nr:DUF5522 domain-containing protein [Lacibacter luteus]RXK60864.1 hypothetical protein ESA94_10415 [Lacibacter luteus]